MLLCTALAQWTGSSLTPPAGARDPAQEPAPAPARLIHAMERQLSRDELRRALLTLLPAHTNTLPGANASDLEYFTNAAELLLRHGVATAFMDYLKSADPRHGDANLRWQSSATDQAPSQLTIRSCERLASRGILAPSERPFSWHVTPPLFYWWLLDQLHELAVLSPHQWLAMHKLEQHITLQDARALRAQVLQHELLVREGATRLVDEVCR